MRTQSGIRGIGIALVLLAVSCGKSNDPASREGPSLSTSSGSSVSLHVGETVVVNNVEITFISVLEDSRCPTDVTCVWAGNAQIEIGVGPSSGGDGPTFQVILNSNQGPHSGDAWGQRITLVDIRPAPVSTEPIPKDAYEIDLKVERIGRGEARKVPGT